MLLRFGLPVLLLLVPAALAAQDVPEPTVEPVTLLPGDAVMVTIWREEDLSGEFPVNQNGSVVLPLLGEKQVTGIPIERLRQMLIEEYRVQLRNPSIEITPLRRINILGEVDEPGLYAVDPTISLAGAIALAGGTTSAGDLNRIRILRGGQVLRERVAAATPLTSADIRSGDQIFVEQRSWLSRNTNFLISIGLAVPSTVAGVIGLVRLMDN